MSATITSITTGRQMQFAETRTVDVIRESDGSFYVQECSIGAGSCGILRTFGPDERERAVAYALEVIPQFAPCKLGRVDE